MKYTNGLQERILVFSDVMHQVYSARFTIASLGEMLNFPYMEVLITNLFCPFIPVVLWEMLNAVTF